MIVYPDSSNVFMTRNKLRCSNGRSVLIEHIVPDMDVDLLNVCILPFHWYIGTLDRTTTCVIGIAKLSKTPINSNHYMCDWNSKVVKKTPINSNHYMCNGNTKVLKNVHKLPLGIYHFIGISED